MEKRFPAIFGIITLVLLCAGAFSPWWFAFDTAELRAKMSGERHQSSDSIIEVHMGLFYCVAIGEDFRKLVGYGDFIGSNAISMYFCYYIGWIKAFMTIFIFINYVRGIQMRHELNKKINQNNHKHLHVIFCMT